MSDDDVVLGSVIAIFSDDIFHRVFHSTKCFLSDLRSCIEEKNNGNIYDERTQYLMVKAKIRHGLAINLYTRDLIKTLTRSYRIKMRKFANFRKFTRIS